MQDRPPINYGVEQTDTEHGNPRTFTKEEGAFWVTYHDCVRSPVKGDLVTHYEYDLMTARLVTWRER